MSVSTNIFINGKLDNPYYALISDHPGGTTLETYRGIAQDLLTFAAANFWPGTGPWTAFALPGQDTQGKIREICNITAIFKMKDPDSGDWEYSPV